MDSICMSCLRGGFHGIPKALAGGGPKLGGIVTNAFLERPKKAASAGIAASTRYLVDRECVRFQKRCCVTHADLAQNCHRRRSKRLSESNHESRTAQARGMAEGENGVR